MKTRRGQAGRGPSRKSNSSSRPLLERFEDRLLMTVFDVTNTSDSGTGSLRDAITMSNASTTGLPNVIDFSMLAPGLQTISPKTPLPAITQQVIIDGTTSAAYQANLTTNPNNPRPFIEITGNNPLNTTGSAGFVINSTNVTLKALVIDNWNGAGVSINGIGDAVSGCWIGIDPTGGVKAPNTGVGVLVSASNSTIGGTTAADRNVISGNNAGINVTGGGATGNLIEGNFIGTDATGLVKLGNTFDGIDISTANNTIGGATSVVNNLISGAGNVISGDFAGLNISNTGSNGNVIEGNFIGTDATGLGAMPNVFEGLNLDSVKNTVVGGADPTLKNVISANGFDGIDISSATSTNNRIEGNYIGVGVNGFSALGNGGNGILVNGAGNTIIGGAALVGSTPQLGNIIAHSGGTFSSDPGVLVQGAQNVGILTNQIYANGGLGIQLSQSNQGVTAPTITSVQSGAAQTLVSGTYFGLPSTTYRLQFFSNQSPDPSGAGEGQNFIGEFNITTDSVGNATFKQKLPLGVPVGEYVSATATEGPTTVNNTSQFSGDVQATQAQVTDLAVAVAVPSTPPLLNQNYTYTVTVTNNGPNDATGVILTDTIPTNSTFVSASGGVFAAGALTDDIGALSSAPGANSVVVTITVKATSLGTANAFTNVASVTGNELDSNTNNNTVTTNGTVAVNADLTANLTVSASPAPVGSPITYSLVIGNNGPSTVNDATVTVDLPASLSNVVVSPDQGTFTQTGNTLTISLGVIPANTSSTTTIVGTPSATGTITTTATVTSSILDSNPANNTATLPVTIANAADLGLTITSAPDPVLTGQELFYTLTVTNNGPSDATQPVVVDQLPAGLTFVPADSNAGPNGVITLNQGVVSVNLNPTGNSPLVAGGTDTITLAVIPTISGQVTNTATVGDPDTVNPVEIDPDLSNNTASTTTQVSPADVGVTINNPPDPLLVGTQAVFQVVVNNDGPADATNVTLNDSFGSGATIVSSSAGTPSGGNLVVDLGTLASGASTTVTITVDPTVAGNLIDTATVAADQLDPNPNNNSASSSNVVSPVDLGVTVTGAPSPVLIDGQIVYVVTVTNAGPTTANNVLINDTLPGSATLFSATTSQGTVTGSSTAVTGNLGTLAPGASATVTILVSVGTVSTATDTAAVTSDDFDTNTANNTGSASVSVINLPGAIAFDTPVALVPENAGTVTLTLDRTGGSLGAVTVDYATSDYTAVAGVNYVASNGTVSFADGQTTATITIPVLDDLKVNGSNGFFVTLSNPTGGVSLGTPDMAAVLVTNTDRDTIPPYVSSLIAIPNGSSLNGFVLFFDKAMDPTRASLVSNYHLFSTNGSVGTAGQTPIPIAAAIYSPINDSVTLVPTAPLPANRFYHIIANGSFGDVLTDASANTLAGSSGVGSNYDIYYGQGTSLQYTDSKANQVTINVSGGGSMAIFRGSSGDAAALDLYQVVPHKTKLSGSVKKLTRTSSGQTTINMISGLGQFGDVNSSLTTPDFYVISAPVGVSTITGTTQVTAASVTVSGKKTPKGPRG